MTRTELIAAYLITADELPAFDKALANLDAAIEEADGIDTKQKIASYYCNCRTAEIAAWYCEIAVARGFDDG